MQDVPLRRKEKKKKKKRKARARGAEATQADGVERLAAQSRAERRSPRLRSSKTGENGLSDDI